MNNVGYLQCLHAHTQSQHLKFQQTTKKYKITEVPQRVAKRFSAIQALLRNMQK